MCSRYEVKVPVERMIERFGLAVTDITFGAGAAGPEIRPTNSAIVIGTDAVPEILLWGLQVSWQKQPVINARSETAADKPTFKPLLDRRVLIPASAYFEWRRDGRAKIKTRIALPTDDLFAIAGLRDDTHFVMLTCAPSEGVAHIHTRMPVILGRDSEKEWINPDLSYDGIAALMRPFAGPFDIYEFKGAPPKQAELFG